MKKSPTPLYYYFYNRTFIFVIIFYNRTLLSVVILYDSTWFSLQSKYDAGTDSFDHDFNRRFRRV